MKWRVIAGPTTEPISLDLARRHCRITPDSDSPPFHPDDDWLTEIAIPTAREYCEAFMGRAIAPQTVEATFDSFPTTITLPLAPIDSITSITYRDADNVEQTLATSIYVFDSFAEPASIALATGEVWPETYSVANAVRVRYQAGFSGVSDSPDDRPLPAMVKAAMLLMIGHLYENREATNMLFGSAGVQELPLGVEALLIPHQLRMSMA